MRRSLIIAEAGVNHDGDPATALRMVGVAARAGADVVKFQTFSADRLATPEAAKAPYQLETTPGEVSQHAMLRALELPDSAYCELLEAARDASIEFLSSPFDERSVALLDDLGMRRFKIPSGELTHTALLQAIGGTRKPAILSTGMSSLGEVEIALRVLEDAGCPDVMLLHCTSAYPADPADVNLRAIETLQRAFGKPVGLSDHTRGIEIACAAVALGAVAIEKHFTLDRGRVGPDHRASLEPDELAALVRAVRNVELSLGDGIKRATPAEQATRAVARKSLVAARTLSPGTPLEAGDLIAKRPGTGIPPSELARVVGRRLQVALEPDELLEWSHLA